MPQTNTPLIDHVVQFLAQRKAEGREKTKVNDEERVQLRNALWLLLRPSQKEKFVTAENAAFDKYVRNQLKNQQPHIKESKAKYEASNPHRMRKTHGTAAKKAT
jgi:hypothetical protein